MTACKLLRSQMSGMLNGETKSLAQEYLKEFPGETEHAKRIETEEGVYRTHLAQKEIQGPRFCDSDFTAPETFRTRWGPCLLDMEDLRAFLSTPDRKFGDIYERPHHPPYTDMVYQTMRNTGIADQIYEIGKNYVGFGFVDMFQLIWGSYPNENEENSVPMKFYGYDRSRVVTLRSKLVYLAMKNFEECDVSITSILQMWFSSCWDSKTKSVFNMLVSEALEDEENSDFDVKDRQLLKAWKKKDFSVKEAKKVFSEGLRNVMFDDLWQMKFECDRVRFCRYLFTGCIFVDENAVVCGNPTMFTDYEGCTKIGEELFFKAFDLNALNFDHLSDNALLYDTIVSATEDATRKFRQRISSGQIECIFETRIVDPENLNFAAFIKSLDPYGIDWSNLPDYMEKNCFIKFARACSVEETVHNLHFINWIQYVLGASHVDWCDKQEDCINLYHDIKKQYELATEITKAIESIRNPLSMFFDGDIYMNNLNELNLYLSIKFREKFEDYFLSDEKGNKLNRSDFSVCDGIRFHFFDQSPTMFRSAFSFNEELELQVNYKGGSLYDLLPSFP